MNKTLDDVLVRDLPSEQGLVVRPLVEKRKLRWENIVNTSIEEAWESLLGFEVQKQSWKKS